MLCTLNWVTFFYSNLRRTVLETKPMAAQDIARPRWSRSSDETYRRSFSEWSTT